MRLDVRHPSPALVVSTLGLVVALSATSYAAFTLPNNGVIHGCYQKTTGNLRVLAAGKKCRTSEKEITWNQTGPRGLRGVKGDKGDQGPQGIPGSQGPQGPGATTISTTLPTGTTGTIATLSNGMLVIAGCTGGRVFVGVQRSSSQVGLQASGSFSNDGAAPTETSEDTSSPFVVSLSTGPGGTVKSDLSWIVGVPGGKYASLDIHGTEGSPCSFWGMTTPSS
jgi:hypothetical protein